MQYAEIIVVGIFFGTLARFAFLKIDYRQYPSYPHGYVTHLSLGFIAAALGAVALPALLEKDFTAVTFLALAAQQFREVRNMERESLAQIDQHELIPRGEEFIEGIAKIFEARNYIVMIVSLTTSVMDYFYGVIPAAFSAAALLFFFGYLLRGRRIGELAEVVPVELSFEGSLLKVDKIVIMNVGLPDSREKILKDGLGVMIKPKNDNARATLDSLGQRQTIVHISTALIGTKKELDNQDFTPMVKKDIDTGALAFFIVPIEKDIECLIEAVNRTPVLESAWRQPLKAKVGRIAAD